MTHSLLIHEVGLRDGLQMEAQVVPLETKLAWVEGLVESGVDIIQVGSFVHPTKVPQMADTDDLFGEIRSRNLGDGKVAHPPLLSGRPARAREAGPAPPVARALDHASRPRSRGR